MKIETDSDFVCRTAHILMCETLSDIEKLSCIKLIYRELAFPEIERTKEEDKLLSNLEEPVIGRVVELN